MRLRIPALAAAVLVFGLAACGNDGAATAPAVPEATTATTAPAETTEAPTEQGGQPTPEAAAEVMIAAFSNNDPRGACAIIAANGQPVEGNADAMDACEEALKPILGQLGEALSSLRGTTVEGATINGDEATFENATTTPAEAKSLVEGRTAVKIGDKWYITQ